MAFWVPRDFHGNSSANAVVMGKFDEKRQLEHFLRDRFGAIILFGFRTKFPLLPSPCNPHNMAPRFAKRIASTRYGLG
jgi:hypothetical protein